MMWYYVVDDEYKESYFLKYHNSNGEYSFYVTNFIEIWESMYSNADLYTLIKVHNPLIDAENSSLVNKCIDMLCKSFIEKRTESSIAFNNLPRKHISLNIKILKGSFPFSIVFNLNLSSPLKFFEEVTIPLMTNVKELAESEKHLIVCLQKKDIEIQEYKSEGAKISLKHLETNVFDEKEHAILFTPSCEKFPYTNHITSILTQRENHKRNPGLNEECITNSKPLAAENVVEGESCDVKPNVSCDSVKREYEQSMAEINLLPIVKDENSKQDCINRPNQEKKKRKKLLNFN